MTSASLQVLGDCKNYNAFDGEKSSKKKWKDITNDTDPPAAGRPPSQSHTKPSSWKHRKVDDTNPPSKSHSRKHHCHSPLSSPSASNSDNESRSSDIQEIIRPSNKDLAKTLEMLAAFKSDLFTNINLSQLGTSKVKSHYYEASGDYQPCASPSKWWHASLSKL